MLQNYLRLDLACRLAILGTKEDNIKSRHFVALSNIIHSDKHSDTDWRAKKPPFNLLIFYP